ncbi:helix-turn-helix domain-containing protein [Paenibacillus sp. 7124]|uniref:Helix-turn-helix domain-containing protein n=1 Tax=Paenibacillus apii TaxID=1850370 RepID=A0A6M1PL00_9BACL|nr:helix-turn-helix domain-containing protein [Paenibacillus apii]NGM83950.1 helix-turn-helix domain-containing protein [Paenibacillus apii]
MQQVYSVSELAEYLKVSTDSIYTMVREKQIPHVRVRKRIIFPMNMIEEWLNNQQIY